MENTVAPAELDPVLTQHIEATIRALRRESPNRLTPKRVLVMISLIASTVVALGGALTYGINVYTMYGWVTKQEFAEAQKNYAALFESKTDYVQDKLLNEARNERQDGELKSQAATSNEILAFVKVVPQLKVMIRIRCMGNSGVQVTIDELHKQFRDLTGHDYQEPGCADPEIKGVK